VAHGAPPTRRTLFLFWSRFTKKLVPNFKVVSSAACGGLASERVGSKSRRRRDIKKRKKFKELIYNLNGATGGLNKKLLSVVRLRHQKKQFPKLLRS